MKPAMLLIRLLAVFSAVAIMGGECDIEYDDGRLEIDQDNDDDFEDFWEDLFD